MVLRMKDRYPFIMSPGICLFAPINFLNIQKNELVLACNCGSQNKYEKVKEPVRDLSVLSWDPKVLWDSQGTGSGGSLLFQRTAPWYPTKEGGVLGVVNIHEKVLRLMRKALRVLEIHEKILEIKRTSELTLWGSWTLNYWY